MVFTDDTRKDLGIIHALQVVAQPGKFRGTALLKHTHILRKLKMTTATLNTYYCAICASIAKFASKTLTKVIDTCDSIGRARAAASLAQMGYHKEAKALMLKEAEDNV